DIQTQTEYFEYSHSFDRGELTDEETMHLGGILHATESKPIIKKKTLALLAHLGTVTAYRQIEKYFVYPDPELKGWAALALQECRMFLESTLLDSSMGFISTGLGGLADRMRYYFLVLPLAGAEFTEEQQKIIDTESKDVAKKLSCIVESVNPSAIYVG